MHNVISFGIDYVYYHYLCTLDVELLRWKMSMSSYVSIMIRMITLIHEQLNSRNPHTWHTSRTGYAALKQ